jgi:integrase-like protein
MPTDLMTFIRSFWPDWIARMSGGASLVLTFWGIVWNHPIKRWHVFLAAFICYFLASFRVWQKESQKRRRAEPIVIDILERFESRSAYLVKRYTEVRDEFGNRGQGTQHDGLEKNLTKPFRKTWFIAPYDYWGYALHGLWLLILELKEDIEKFNTASGKPLKWKHVDLERRILRIEHSLWRGQLLSPKTTASTRDIPLGSALNETLRNHRESSLHRGPDDFVFCKKDGSALDPDVLRKDALYPILDRLGFPRKKGASGFHTFRHSAASIVNEQTGNLKLAQKFLGHSTIKMTADIYTHTSAEAERDAAIALERAIYGDLFPVVPNIENRNNFAALN